MMMMMIIIIIIITTMSESVNKSDLLHKAYKYNKGSVACDN